MSCDDMVNAEPQFHLLLTGQLVFQLSFLLGGVEYAEKQYMNEIILTW